MSKHELNRLALNQAPLNTNIQTQFKQTSMNRHSGKDTEVSLIETETTKLAENLKSQDSPTTKTNYKFGNGSVAFTL